ncbi:uncharacterized protein LOC128217749 isoform X2 [Mya arenaria]|uniref:uncharacterized protein LOC128217749 isoform X2 n=1 Tax=Mya arenaria TaxID=6604 RepID=UPI0022E039D6|nr:uncharacterized protein LOC128217749 isoform X2 [Mya arenaria]
MGLTDDRMLYISTCRNITLWHLNNFFTFWSLARNQVTSLSLASCEEKTTRIVAVGDDSSVRMFCRSNHKNITTVLPPPDISPLQKVLSVCYSREKNAAFLLVNNREIWVYTTRTDPSSRIAIWNVHDLQLPYISGDTSLLPPGVVIQPPSQTLAAHRATENGNGNESVTNCCSLCILNSTAMMWTDEGLCCPIRHTYLLLGMEDGRILFMDPVIRGQKYMEFKASKDPIQEMKHDVAHSCLITMCRLKTLVLIQIWGLPHLDPMYEFYCGPDITCYARVGLSILSGHECGQVNLHHLEPVEDQGISKPKQEPAFESVVDEKRRPEHHAPLVALDSLASLQIFVTCSSDGAIKIWDENKVLLTEVMLEESLSAAVFLNEMGDLLVGFKNHIFYIDHSKLCPTFKPPEIEMETSDQESDVYEDPRVLYEMLREEDEPVTLENYLVPYDHLEFDKDFLEGKTKIEQPKTAAEAMAESEESETETDISLAPSSIYMSPADSIESLSMIDLTLGADYSKYDLRDQMRATLDQIGIRAKEENKWKDMNRAKVYLKLRKIQIANAKTSKYVHRRRKKEGKKRSKNIAIEALAQSDMEEREIEMEMEKFSLPAFGMSPGGSPSITPPSGQATPYRDQNEEEFEEYSDDERRSRPRGFIPIIPADKQAPSPVQSDNGSVSTRTMTPESHAHQSLGHSSPSKSRSPSPNKVEVTKTSVQTETSFEIESNEAKPPSEEKCEMELHRDVVEPSVDANDKESDIPDIPDKDGTAIDSLGDKVKDAPKSDVNSKHDLAESSENFGKTATTDVEDNDLSTKTTLSTALSMSAASSKDVKQVEKRSKVIVKNQVRPAPQPVVKAKVQTIPKVQSQSQIKEQPGIKSQQVKTDLSQTVHKSPSVVELKTLKRVANQSAGTKNISDQPVDKSESVKKAPLVKMVSTEFELVMQGLVSDSESENDNELAERVSELDETYQDNSKEHETFAVSKSLSGTGSVSEVDSCLASSDGTEAHINDTGRDIQMVKPLANEGFVASKGEKECIHNSPHDSKTDKIKDDISSGQVDKNTETTIVDIETEQGEINNEKCMEELSDFESMTPRSSQGASGSALEKQLANYDEKDQDGVTRRVKGTKVDVRGLMKKRRITSGRAPSLTRRSSTDHTHDEHDHDHGHDDKRPKKEIKKKQQRERQVDMSKLASLPPNPPSMLTRKRSLGDQQKSLEFNLLHRPEIHRQSDGSHDPNLAQIHFDNEMDAEKLQEEQWAQEAAVTGQPLTLPPQKDKNKARMTDRDKVDPRSLRHKDRKQLFGDKDSVEGHIPGVGSSPTAELEKLDWSESAPGEITKHKENQVNEVGQRIEITDHSGKSATEEGIMDDVRDIDSRAPETQMQRTKRLGYKLDSDKVFENDKGEKVNGMPSIAINRKARPKLNVYIPQAERESVSSAKSSRRGSPDSGIDETGLSTQGCQTPRSLQNKHPGDTDDDDTTLPELSAPDTSLLSEEDKANAIKRPASSFTGLRRGQLEGEKLRAERPHTAHVRFKAEDLQSAFEEALRKYQDLPGTPALISAETLYRNDGLHFEDNWQERVIERHTLLRMQKEIRAQSAAQRRQAIEMIQKDKHTQKLFTSRCESAIGGTMDTASIQTVKRANTSMSVPISLGYGVNMGPPPSRDKPRPKTAFADLEKQQILKNELSQEKAFRYRLSKDGVSTARSRPASSRSISSVADFSPHWIDPRNPSAWRPKSSRSIPSKCNRYVLVNKPKEKVSDPVPSPLEEQLLIERFPKMGQKIVTMPELITPRIKKSYNYEYSPFVYQRLA